VRPSAFAVLKLISNFAPGLLYVAVCAFSHPRLHGDVASIRFSRMSGVGPLCPIADIRTRTCRADGFLAARGRCLQCEQDPQCQRRNPKRSKTLGRVMIRFRRRHHRPSARCPLYSQKQTYAVQQLMSAIADIPRFTRSPRQCVEHTDGDGGEMFQAVCKTWLEGTKSKSPQPAVN
jgi:hypothetical protein